MLVYLHQYIERGYLPDALLNYLARLGWSFDGTQEIFTRAELIEKFTLERVTSSPASHDQDKLFWIQGEWMKALPLDQKVAGVLPYLRARGPRRRARHGCRSSTIEAVILALGDRLKVFSDILKLGRFFFATELILDPDAMKKGFARTPCRRCWPSSMRFSPKSTGTIWRLSRRWSTLMPNAPGARWATSSIRCVSPQPVRPSAPDFTTACSSWAARPVAIASRRRSECSKETTWPRPRHSLPSPRGLPRFAAASHGFPASGEIVCLQPKFAESKKD